MAVAARRVIQLTPRFHARLRACGVRRGSASWHAVLGTISALGRQTLPTAEDEPAMIPPVHQVWSREVRGHGFVVYFRFAEERVVILTIAHV